VQVANGIEGFITHGIAYCGGCLDKENSQSLPQLFNIERTSSWKSLYRFSRSSDDPLSIRALQLENPAGGDGGVFSLNVMGAFFRSRPRPFPPCVELLPANLS
jgi:hypothetical protein